ncbi:MAG TPA: hypothetical protein VM261_36715 [Kofleriaceae bacterium]|nr:hypothetical protein [Kofleriaceae bacterium]
MRAWLYSDYLTTPVDTGDRADRDLDSWPPELRQLVEDIQTIDALDVMCTVAREPERRWRYTELPVRDAGALADSLRHLVARGLLDRHDDGSVQLSPNGAHVPMVSALVNRYDDDRPNMLGAFAQLSIERIRSTAVRALMRRGPAEPENDDR